MAYLYNISSFISFTDCSCSIYTSSLVFTNWCIVRITACSTFTTEFIPLFLQNEINWTVQVEKLYIECLFSNFRILLWKMCYSLYENDKIKSFFICTALPQFMLALWFFSSITISWRLSWIINRIPFKILKEKIICSKVNKDLIVYLTSSAEEFHVVVIWSKPLIHPPHGGSLGWIYHVPVWLTYRQQAS